MRAGRVWESTDPTSPCGTAPSEQRAALEAISHGRFDGAADQAFVVAKEPLQGLALEYAALADVDAESSAMAVAGGRLVGIHWMHDTRDEALLSAAGCTASFEFETDLIK